MLEGAGDLGEIRSAVRELCSDFPGDYWRGLEPDRYPEGFVRALTGAGWVVRGQKLWTSRALHSDLMLLLARTTPLDRVEKRPQGLSVFVVDLRGRATGSRSRRSGR